MQEIVQAYGALKKKFDGELDYSDTDSETDFDDLMEAFIFRYFNRYRFGCGNCGHNFRSRDSSYMSGEGSSQKKEWKLNLNLWNQNLNLRSVVKKSNVKR